MGMATSDPNHAFSFYEGPLMSSRIDYTTRELRRKILSGEVAPGNRMVELELSAQLAVSRTPIRIALGELEKEGLLERLPTRGFRVRQFTVDEIANEIGRASCRERV